MWGSQRFLMSGKVFNGRKFVLILRKVILGLKIGLVRANGDNRKGLITMT